MTMGADRRILIVEDHPTMREAMRLVLEGEGFAIEEAADGEAALASIHASPPDLLFLDLNIPGTPGTGVLEAVRSDPSLADVRVIVVNAAKIRLTGRKEEQKLYRRHSGYPGGLTETGARVVRQTRPERMVEEAVQGMLPKTKLGKQMYRKLKVYAGAKHPHDAQKPVEMAVRPLMNGNEIKTDHDALLAGPTV